MLQCGSIRKVFLCNAAFRSWNGSKVTTKKTLELAILLACMQHFEAHPEQKWPVENHFYGLKK